MGASTNLQGLLPRDGGHGFATKAGAQFGRRFARPVAEDWLRALARWCLAIVAQVAAAAKNVRALLSVFSGHLSLAGSRRARRDRNGASAEARGVDARSPSNVRQHARFGQLPKLGSAHEDGLKGFRWADAVHTRAEIDE